MISTRWRFWNSTWVCVLLSHCQEEDAAEKFTQCLGCIRLSYWLLCKPATNNISPGGCTFKLLTALANSVVGPHMAQHGTAYLSIGYCPFFVPAPRTKARVAGVDSPETARYTPQSSCLCWHVPSWT
ncbi:hypothetical protein NW759_006511 [Fusarium solani]|nr:hypothetical protein NW759_006511 [Fusarium solani]